MSEATRKALSAAERALVTVQELIDENRQLRAVIAAMQAPEFSAHKPKALDLTDFNRGLCRHGNDAGQCLLCHQEQGYKPESLDLTTGCIHEWVGTDYKYYQCQKCGKRSNDPTRD